MSEFKYTTDGKKVVVIGKLNATETIVQEIFVRTDGSEIPSGEQFVTKSLHDAPSISWKEKREKEIAESLYRTEEEAKIKTARMLREMQLADVKASALYAFNKSATREQLKTLQAFVSGEIKYLCISKYSDLTIVPFDDAIPQREDHQRIEWLRLLSLFGRTNGDMQWRIGQYSDGSGCDEIVFPAKSLDDAVSIAQCRFDALVTEWRTAKKTYPPSADFAGELGKGRIKIPADVIAWHKQTREEGRNAEITRLRKQLAELEKAVTE